MRVGLLVGWLLLLGSHDGRTQDWPDRRAAGPFMFYADFSLDRYANLVAEMARLHQDLHESLGVGLPDDRINLFLFQDRTSYQGYLREYFPNVPSRRALFIKGRGSGMVFAYQNPQFDIDVRHEGTHALLHAHFPRVPLWLDEGLAEYFELPPEDRAFHNPHMPTVKWAVRFRRVPDLRILEELREVEQMGKSEYRAAWAWVHFLFHGPAEVRNVLGRYLRDIHADVPSGPLSQRLLHRRPDLDGQFIRHFRHWKRP